MRIHQHIPCFLAVMFAHSALAQITVRSGTGANAAAITATRDQFRVDLGGGTVAGANGSFGGLRREVNWDGVPAASSAPNSMAGTFFNLTSPRGVVVTPVSPGTGFQVSGAVSDAGTGQPVAARFGNINATYSGIFQAFSAQRLFTPLGNNQFDVTFFMPGTSTPAVVLGFGAVFADVDVAGTTALQFFDTSGTSLGGFAASPIGNGFSFLGAFTPGVKRINRVRVTLGNTIIGPDDNNGSSDIVVMDDFVYGEPTEAPIFADGFEV
jgi:hypothetical protein